MNNDLVNCVKIVLTQAEKKNYFSFINKSFNQWRSQGGGGHDPEIGFTRKFLAAPLS